MKTNLKSLMAVICSGILVLSGCGNKSDETNTTSSVKKDYDIFVYNSDTDIGTSFRAMCDEYTNRTGVIIRTVTPPENANTVSELEDYLSGEYPPDIFCVNNLSELKKWKSSESVWDFSNATEDSFKALVNDIPEPLKLSSNTTDSLGVPYTVEGYGYLVDPKMISSLFGGDKYRNALTDLEECSYDEFYSMVEALKQYISTSAVYEFSLNGKNYSFVGNKGDMSKNLCGVFSFAAGNSKNSGAYLSNIALASVFSSAASANIANDESVAALKTPLIRFAELLDLITSNVAGSAGILGRGTGLVSNSQNSVSRSMKNFVNGKSVFLLAGTEDYKDMAMFDSQVAKRCIFMPIKIPCSESEIISSEDMAKNLHRSITTYSPRYYCINAKSSDSEKKKAQDFLTWMMTSELAQKYVISDFGFTPFNIKESSVIDNPFSRSMIEYLSEKRIVPAAFLGAPEKWCGETLGKYLIEQYFTKAAWSYDDYSNIADYGIKKWKELKSSEN